MAKFGSKIQKTFFAEIPSENDLEEGDACRDSKILLVRSTNFSSRKVNYALELISRALDQKEDKGGFITDQMRRKFGGSRWICTWAKAPLQFHSHSEEVLIVKADDFIVIIVKL